MDMAAKKGKGAKLAAIAVLLVGVVLLGVSGYLYYQYYAVPRCPACGMLITPEIDEHFNIRDDLGNRLHACCPGCALRLLDPVRGWRNLHIETYCDYYGPKHRIVIDAKDHGAVVTVNPSTARILLGGKVVKGCVNNRIAYNSTAVEGLLREGYTKYTMSWMQVKLPEGTPVMPVDKLAPTIAKDMGIQYVPPSPAMIAGIAIVGIVILVASIVAYRKLMPKVVQ